MRYDVLGALRIRDDHGEPIELSSAKQRLVLALLLYRRGQPLSADRLLDLLWDGEPPRTARTNLQVYVHRLRQALGEGRIQHGPDGYRLIAEPGEIDAVLFEEHAAGGRHREALDLWYGDAYAGFADVDVLRDEASRLAELRLLSYEERVESDLELGQHAALVAELQQLVGQHPLRERLRGQLMLALYRCGRTAEAAEVYRTGRAALVEELGLEPGPELRRLEQAILSGDPSLELTPVVPAQLPAAARWFTGREEQLARITALLTERPVDGSVPIVAIDGPGGLGKSALAVHAAHRVAGAFPDAQLYVNLRAATPGAEPLTPGEVLARFLRALGRPDAPHEPEEAAAAFRSLTAGRRVLVVLDDAQDAAHVRPLLPGSPGPAVLVTSRTALAAVDGASAEHLDVLAEPDALELLTRMAGPERVRDQRADAIRIVQLCGGLPLAVRIAGARLMARPGWRLSALAARLSDNRARLDELEHADLAVRASFAVGHAMLPDDDARLLELIGWVGLPDFTVPVAAAMAGRPEGVVRRCLDRLAEAQLVQEENERYSVHDLIGLFAREQAGERLTDADRAEAVRRVLHWYIGTARSGVRVISPYADHRWRFGTTDLLCAGLEIHDADEAIRWIDAEHRNLETVVSQALSNGAEEASAVAALAAAASQLFVQSERIEAAEQLNATLLSQATEASVHEPAVVAQALIDLGIACQLMNRIALGVEYLDRGAAAWEELDDRLGLASALNSLGAGLIMHADFDRARGVLIRAVELHRDLGHADGENRALTNLGALAFQQGRYDEALAAFERRVEVGVAGGNLTGFGIALENLATTWQRLGDHRRALAAFERALEVHREAASRQGTVTALWGCGESLHALGDHAAARSQWTEATDLLVQLHRLTAAEAVELLAAEVPRNPYLPPAE
ncbi:AfsR/SARP family transcriptional regulator [Kribbella shirazensis]|uniref:DNA-binding SARP family transcriptional activator/Tfp pilus assembly protein PilF n=1 Tax=Kribbella shirazensis TaxID=1105143 RepID=A0A7X5V8G5_9ACTN|nr:BTAD domain-containing putative transcriptional regulator [Kribbella shirazensis]NIK55793.1 DNA-binding SARP family transcriptional activator/Tfp pilus assembly protein PilF [Kribbella shirazensis]